MAKTSSIPDYAAHNNDLDSFYIDNQSLIAGCAAGRLSQSEKLTMETEEKEIVGNVLKQMIRFVSTLQFAFHFCTVKPLNRGYTEGNVYRAVSSPLFRGSNVSEL